MIGGVPFVVVLFFAAAATSFLSALFPRWDIRWGGRGGSFKDKTPMSPRGRCAFGTYALSLAVTCVVGMRWPELWNFLVLVVGLGGLIALGVVYRHDKNEHQNPPAN
jgi:hypothetical protein